MTAAATQRAPQWAGASHGRRSRYGAIGLVASAAIAVMASLLWASPSAGAPPDQAITVPAQVGQAHSLPPSMTTPTDDLTPAAKGELPVTPRRRSNRTGCGSW